MAGQRRGFVTAGTWCLDRNIIVDRWPQEDMLATALDMTLSGGGSACNFALDMRRLDPSVPVETMGLLATDEPGDFLRKVAVEAGIADRFTRTGDAATQTTDAYVSAASGRRTHIAFLGTARLLSPDHFDFSASTARMLHLGLPGLHEIMDAPFGADANGWVATLRKARSAGLETNMELVATTPERIRQLVLPCLPHLTTLVVNDFEAGALASVETIVDGKTNEAACERAARTVLAAGDLEAVVVHYTMGAVLVARGGDCARMASVAMPAAEIRGANGAGDAFAAGFHYARQAGWTHGECLRMAHAAAAASLRAADPSSAVADAAACLSFADRCGWRG